MFSALGVICHVFRSDRLSDELATLRGTVASLRDMADKYALLERAWQQFGEEDDKREKSVVEGITLYLEESSTDLKEFVHVLSFSLCLHADSCICCDTKSTVSPLEQVR